MYNQQSPTFALLQSNELANAAIRIGILFIVFFNQIFFIFSPSAVMSDVLARFSAENAHSA